MPNCAKIPEAFEAELLAAIFDPPAREVCMASLAICFAWRRRFATVLRTIYGESSANSTTALDRPRIRREAVLSFTAGKNARTVSAVSGGNVDKP